MANVNRLILKSIAKSGATLKSNIISIEFFVFFIWVNFFILWGLGKD